MVLPTLLNILTNPSDMRWNPPAIPSLMLCIEGRGPPSPPDQELPDPCGRPTPCIQYGKYQVGIGMVSIWANLLTHLLSKLKAMA